LYKYCPGRLFPDEYDDIPEWEDLKLCVPDIFVPQVISSYHNGRWSGHGGITKTLWRLTSRVCWKGMRRDVRDFIRKCRECQLVKVDKMKPAGLMMPTQNPRPFEEWTCDFVGPIQPATKRGNKWIFMCCDKGTRWCEAVALKTANGCDAITFMLEEIFARYGTPYHIVSDNGRQFISTAWVAFCKRLNIRHILTSTYHPQSNITERYNQTGLEMIRLMYQENPQDWDILLPSVLSCMRSAVNVTTGFSPNQLVLGVTTRIPSDFVWQIGPHNVEKEAGKRNVAQELFRQEQMLKARQKAMIAWDKASLVNKVRYDAGHRDVTFDKGDSVGMRLLQTADRTEHHTISQKIGPKFSGPWEVARITSPVSYIIVKNGYYPRRVYVQNIRLWHEIRDEQRGTEEMDFDPDDPKNVDKSIISDSVPNVQLTGDDDDDYDDEGDVDGRITLNRVFNDPESEERGGRHQQDYISDSNPNNPSSSGGVRTRSQRQRHPSEMDDYEIIPSVRRVSCGIKRYSLSNLLYSIPSLAVPTTPAATPVSEAAATSAVATAACPVGENVSTSGGEGEGKEERERRTDGRQICSSSATARSGPNERVSYPGGSPWERRTGRGSAGPREIDPTAGRSDEQDGGPTGTAAESADEIGPPAGASGRQA